MENARATEQAGKRLDFVNALVADDGPVLVERLWCEGDGSEHWAAS
jgi:hypothetical protein